VRDNTPKWTPGPWVAERANVGDRHPLFVTTPTTAFHPPCDADAHLIAAAPELYAALALYVEHFGDPLKVGRAALLKANPARGEKSNEL
jgi:hypothetical protein